MLPVIGISVTPTMADDCLMDAVNRVYVSAVSEAGGLPVILPTLEPALLPAMLDRLDGVVLSGGGDVDPRHFGQEPSPDLGPVDAHRDAWELAMARSCWDRRLPMLGICRGMQVMNVARGGTLVQHLPDRSALDHRVADRFAELVHRVHLIEGSTAAAVLGGTVLDVNTLHHQAVDVPGRGLRISGRAPDDTVEVIEAIGTEPFLGVQWHPELLTAHAPQRALFHWVVDHARRERDVTHRGGEPAALEVAADRAAA